MMRTNALSVFLLAALLSMPFRSGSAQPAPSSDAAKRGEYIFDASGCASCHTNPKTKDKPLAGGRAFKSPFGTFYSPNITPDPEHGLGKWSERDFIEALRQGKTPGGSHYYPSFPYTSYTRMKDEDAKDLWAYMKTLKPIAFANKPHDLPWPLNYRFLLIAWKWLFFEPGVFEPEPGKPGQWNRGAYLVSLAHCAECHSPRNFLGGLDRDRLFAGTRSAPEGGSVPNITPDKETGIGEWSKSQIADLLSLGMLPDGDFVGSSMGDVIENTTGKLSKTDLEAMVVYLESLPPVRHDVTAK